MGYRNGNVLTYIVILIYTAVLGINLQTISDTNDCPWGTETIKVTQENLLSNQVSKSAFILCSEISSRASCELFCEPEVQNANFNCSATSKIENMNINLEISHNESSRWILCKIETRASISIIISCQETQSPPPKSISCKGTFERSRVDYPIVLGCTSGDCAYKEGLTSSTTATPSDRTPNTNYSSTTKPTTQSGTQEVKDDNSSTLIVGVVGGIAAFVVIGVIVFIIVFRQRMGRFPFLKKSHEKGERPVYTLPTPDVRKSPLVRGTELSTSHVYEDVDGGNSHGLVKKLPSTHEGDYLELIGPDDPSNQQSSTSDKSVDDKPHREDLHTYQNV